MILRTRVKFCGCTSWEDVRLAIETGADAVGLIFAESPRRIGVDAVAAIADRLPPFVTPVGVFVDPAPEEIARARGIVPDLVVQLSGDEDPEFVASVGGTVIKAIHVDPSRAQAEDLQRAAARFPQAIAMFDTSVAGLAGGTGATFPWDAVAAIAAARPVLVAGGLTPGNVGGCVATVRPFGVDVRSGIETGGRKDPAKMRAFVRAVRDADAA